MSKYCCRKMRYLEEAKICLGKNFKAANDNTLDAAIAEDEICQFKKQLDS